MDYKVAGSSFYNNFEWIQTKGFDSQVVYENGGVIAKVAEVKKETNSESDKLLKQLQEQQRELDKKQEELTQRYLEMEKKTAEKI